MHETVFSQIKNWMYRNARPLDLARWQYHFEDYSKDQVLLYLKAYQNEDGGFSKALEADSWNPNSSPIQTWVATEILKEINFEDKNHPIIKGILAYLASGKDFLNHRWLNTIKSNNDYPCAPWWRYIDDKSASEGFNPSICLAGFVIQYGHKDSQLYHTCVAIIEEGLDDFMAKDESEMHVLSNYVSLLDYLVDTNFKIDRLDLFKEKLTEAVNKLIEKDTSKWAREYVCRPSQFINSPDSIFYDTNAEIVALELDFLMKERNPEGVWSIPWQWGAFDDAYAISSRWWQGALVVKYMLFLKNFKPL